jgi:hypothetical protein
VGEAPRDGSEALTVDRRRGFVLTAGSILLFAFALLVVRPGVERGGVQEVLIIGVIFAFILLFERYLRTR